jgi:DNA-3-methyladenine glycosylase II
MTNPILTIATPKNFSFNKCLKFLNRGYDECLYQVNDTQVTRLIRLSSGLVLIKITADQTNLFISTNKGQMDNRDKEEIKAYVLDWFDLNRDIQPFYQLLTVQEETKEFATNYHGLRLMGIVDLFEALCWCVIGQQINLTFAHKIKTRLVHKYGESLKYGQHTHYCFPSPETLLKVEREDLVAMQFSKQKINYINNISAAFCTNEINKMVLLKLSKMQQMEKLLAIKGIGPWTANYVSMKSLRNMSCIAYGDTGLSSALHSHFATEKKPTNQVINKIFEPFKGWESYFNFYLWRSLS